eukprot:scaffold792_cov84-Cylindrotheca_fusiformis.AAC.2
MAERSTSGIKSRKANRRLTSKSKSKKNSASSKGSPQDGSIAPCLQRFNAVFLQFSAVTPAVYNDPNDRNAQEVGTRFVYNDDLRYLPILDSIPESRVSGVCTRTRSRIGDNQIGLQVGMGHCQFTYRILNAGEEIIFTASGEVSDSIGGILPITGGALGAAGAYGQVKLEPITAGPDGSISSNNGDFFLDPNFYRVEASLTFPCN